jgi:hypothetical protein
MPTKHEPGSPPPPDSEKEKESRLKKLRQILLIINLIEHSGTPPKEVEKAKMGFKRLSKEDYSRKNALTYKKNFLAEILEHIDTIGDTTANPEDRNKARDAYRILTNEKYKTENAQIYEQQYKDTFGKSYWEMKREAEDRKKQAEEAKKRAEETRKRAEGAAKKKAEEEAERKKTGKKTHTKADFDPKTPPPPPSPEDSETGAPPPKGGESGAEAPPPPPPENPETPEGEPSPEDEDNLPLEEGLTRAERVQLALRGVARIIGGTLETLTGLRFARTILPGLHAIALGFQDRARSRALRKEKNAFLTILSEIENAQEDLASAQQAEEGKTKKEKRAQEEKKNELENNLLKKEAELQNKINRLVEGKIIDPETADSLNAQLQEIITTAHKSEDGITQKTERDIINTLHAYVIRKSDRNALLEFAKQGANLTFILTGLQTARALTYAGLSVYQRTQRRLAENERLIREGKPKEVQSLWRDLTRTAPLELLQGLGNTARIVTDLAMRKRVSAADWATQTQSSGKALGNLMIFAGMVGIAHTEIQSTGMDIQAGNLHQIDTLLHNLESKGLGQTLWDNWVVNVDRATLGAIGGLRNISEGFLHGTSVLGGVHEETSHTPHHSPQQPKVQPETHPAEPAKTFAGEKHAEQPQGEQPAEKVPPPPHVEAPSQHPLSENQTLEKFYQENPLLKPHAETAPGIQEEVRAYNQSEGAYRQEPEAVNIDINYVSAVPHQPPPIHAEVSFGSHGDYQHIDQYLRRLAVSSMDKASLHGHGTFDHIDAARVENVVANIRNALLNKEDTVLAPGQASLEGIAHLEGNKLIIDDYVQFYKLSHTLFGHAEQIITEQSGALHYIDNTAHSVWQKMWDVKLQGTHDHVSVEDFSRYHHVEPPVSHAPHTPESIYETPPAPSISHVEVPPSVIAPIHEQSSSLPAAQESIGGVSIMSTHVVPGLTHNLVIETGSASSSGEASASAAPHATPSPAETASASAHTDARATEAPASATPQETIQHWTVTDFSQKFSEGTFSRDFYAAAHANPEAFTTSFMERLVHLRATHGADYYAKLYPDYIYKAVTDTDFQKNISEFITGVLLHKKDTIHINFGATKAEFFASS